MAALLGRLGLILAALAWIPHQVLCSTRERGDAAWLPVHVHVLLVGFGEPLALGASALRKLLADSLPVVTPTLVETGEPFEAAYALTYTVAHADDAQRHALQDAVVAAAIPADPAETMAAADVVVVDVDASQLEAAYARLLGGSSAAKAGAYTVVLQRLDASELAPRLAPRVPRAARVAHRLRYGARGIATQAFVGAGRFVVVDFSAAACAHGLLGAEEGAVSIELVPRLDPPPAAASHAETRASAVAALRAAAAVVVSAIAFVFAPSVRLCPDGPGANSALLLLVALRDHEAFDPFDPEPAAASPAGRVDTAAVERELLRVLPAPRAGAPAVRLLASTHPMHTHPALGVALASSIRSATTHELRHGRLAPVARPFVDAAELTAALARADDVLGGRLARAAAMAAAAGGARLLPLYVLSLAGEDPALALHANLVGHDRARRAEADTASGARGAAAAAAAPGLHGAAEGGLLSVSGTAVVVLAPPRDTIPSLGYFAEGRRLELDGREATRHALGGALGALGGVLPPHESFSLAHNRVETSFLWAVGAHPFGPFARGGESVAAVSDIFADVAQRNQLLCQMRTVGTQLRAAHETLDQFAFDYLRAQLPIEDVGAGAGAAGAAQRAWDARARLARTMPMATLEALMPELATLHADVEAARDAAESEGAHELSARLAAQLDRAAAVAALVHNDVRAARAELACCTLLHEVAIPISATGKLLLGALALAAVAAAALRSPWVGRNKLGSLARARNDRDR